jgi:hypothetical protein
MTTSRIYLNSGLNRVLLARLKPVRASWADKHQQSQRGKAFSDEE